MTTFLIREKVLNFRDYMVEADSLKEAQEKLDQGEEYYVDEEVLETVEDAHIVGYYDDRGEYHRLEESTLEEEA